MNKTVKLLIAGLLILLFGYGTGRYLQPAEVITKTEVVVKEVEKEKTKKNTKIVEIVRPDGTKETVTVIDESSEKEKITDITKKDEKIVKNKKPDWMVSAVALKTEERDISSPEYGVIAQRRILGNVFLGGIVTNDKTYGVTLGMEF